MLLSNAFKPDPRVAREARALANHNYKVTIICWDRQAELPSHEMIDGFQIHRIHTVRSAYGAGWRQLGYLPHFWREAIRLAFKYHPDVIHCHDLDTLYIGVQLKKKLGCKLVYDAHENYPALMSLYLPQLLVIALRHWEKWLMRFVDATITASTVLCDEFMTQSKTPVTTLGNFQEIKSYTKITKAQTQAIRTQLGFPSDVLLVAYIGGFSRNRLLLPFIEAAKLLPKVQFHLWGDGTQKSAIEQTVANHHNVTYHGWLSPNKLPLYFKAMDLIYYCLRLDYPGATYNAPNTLGQAMAAGRPIIANDVGDLGRIVRDTGCGLLLDEVSAPSIATAIQQLQYPEIRMKIGKRGLMAAQTLYNIQSVDRELLNVYDQLFRMEHNS